SPSGAVTRLLEPWIKLNKSTLTSLTLSVRASCVWGRDRLVDFEPIILTDNSLPWSRALVPPHHTRNASQITESQLRYFGHLSMLAIIVCLWNTPPSLYRTLQISLLHRIISGRQSLSSARLQKYQRQSGSNYARSWSHFCFGAQSGHLGQRLQVVD
ncbi:14391_t:CDS:2, partial [Acaulospora colombiana]